MRPTHPLRQTYQGTVIACGAMTAGLFGYLLIVELVRWRAIGFTRPLDMQRLELVQYVFFSLTLLSVALIPVVKCLVLRGPGDLIARLRSVALISLGLE